LTSGPDYGWNQYLWPLLITTDEKMSTIVMHIQRMLFVADAIPEWNLTIAVAMQTSGCWLLDTCRWLLITGIEKRLFIVR